MSAIKESTLADPPARDSIESIFLFIYFFYSSPTTFRRQWPTSGLTLGATCRKAARQKEMGSVSGSFSAFFGLKKKMNITNSCIDTSPTVQRAAAQ